MNRGGVWPAIFLFCVFYKKERDCRLSASLRHSRWVGAAGHADDDWHTRWRERNIRARSSRRKGRRLRGRVTRRRTRGERTDGRLCVALSERALCALRAVHGGELDWPANKACRRLCVPLPRWCVPSSLVRFFPFLFLCCAVRWRLALCRCACLWFVVLVLRASLLVCSFGFRAAGRRTCVVVRSRVRRHARFVAFFVISVNVRAGARFSNHRRK